MIFIRYALFLIVFFQFSCNRKKANELSGLEINMAPEFFIAIDDSTSNTPSVFHKSYQNKYVIFNPNTFSLDFLEKGIGLTNRIKLESEGPFAIKKFLGFEILKDRIFIADLGRIIEIDLKGNKITEFKNLKDSLGIPISPSFFGVNQSFLKNNILYFPVFDFLAFQKEVLEGTIVYSLNLKTNELERDLSYPDFDLSPVSNDYFFHNNVLIFEDEVIFNYSPKEVFRFSRASKNWERKNVISENHLDVRELIGEKTDRKNSKEHLFQNGVYRTIIWDRFRKNYYRFYSSPKGEPDSKKREVRLLISDENLELIKEIEIPNSLIHLGFELNNDGLFLIDGDFSKEHEDSMRFVGVFPN
ncbi:DUF4221 family protein [Algoriphagus sp. PAP.12]|uniref:DUF4221 family protein n=1 Tax=Algoriphagus sp. PAP.12 TaxID=2996678 RepID=UPI00227B6A6E|nr:DUF4221 family protein [Algoriphagus sp. PAP.12]